MLELPAQHRRASAGRAVPHSHLLGLWMGPLLQSAVTSGHLSRQRRSDVQYTYRSLGAHTSRVYARFYLPHGRPHTRAVSESCCFALDVLI